MNQQQRLAFDYLREENRVLKETAWQQKAAAQWRSAQTSGPQEFHEQASGVGAADYFAIEVWTYTGFLRLMGLSFQKGSDCF
jgi:hypothetical protein